MFSIVFIKNYWVLYFLSCHKFGIKFEFTFMGKIVIVVTIHYKLIMSYYEMSNSACFIENIMQ